MRGTSKHAPALPLYTADEAAEVAERVSGVTYGDTLKLASAVSVSFARAGHILGSAIARSISSEYRAGWRETTMNDSPPESRTWLRSRSALVLLGFLAIAAFFLVTEHRAHLLGVLPYLLVLACPLMHFFHRRHGGGRHGHDVPGSSSEGGRP